MTAIVTPAYRHEPAIVAAGALAVAMTVLSMTPAAFVAVEMLRAGWTTAVELIVRPRVGRLLGDTVLLLALAVPICAAVATGLAWLTERSDIPCRSLWRLLGVAPLAIPAFVQSYAWVSLVPGIHGLFGGVLVSVLAYSPFLYLPVAAALRRLDPALEEAAAALGHTPLQIVRRVVLPQLRLALGAGCLIVALHLLSEYGLFALIRFETFTTAIMDQFQSTYTGQAAHMLASVLVLLCLVLVVAEAGLRGSRRFARVGSGSARAPAHVALGGIGTAMAFGFMLVLFGLSLGVPSLTLLRWLLAGGAGVWRTPEVASALLQSLEFAAVGAVLTTVAAFPLAWLAVRRPTRTVRILVGCNYVTAALPGVVVGLALATLAIGLLRPIYQTALLLTLAYVLIFLSRALAGVRASVAQVPPELEQASASLGGAPVSTFLRVTLRLSAPGLAASAILVALGIVNELTATQMLAPIGVRTLAMGFWSLSGEIDYAGAAPYAVLMVLLSLPLVVILHRQSRLSLGE